MIRPEFQAALDEFERKAVESMEQIIRERDERIKKLIADQLEMAAILPSPNFLDG